MLLIDSAFLPMSQGMVSGTVRQRAFALPKQKNQKCTVLLHLPPYPSKSPYLITTIKLQTLATHTTPINQPPHLPRSHTPPRTLRPLKECCIRNAVSVIRTTRTAKTGNVSRAGINAVVSAVRSPGSRVSGRRQMKAQAGSRGDPMIR